MNHTYAKTTNVGIGRSRGEIDKLLRQWQCRAIQWTDDFVKGIVTLRFHWEHGEKYYTARISLQLATDEALREQAKDGRTGKFNPNKLAKLQQSRGQQEHRILLLWLKAAFNAVEAGLISAEVIFLPFLEGNDGQTVAEIALPRLQNLITATSATALLEGH